jgi:Xaa-Pro aminopeptidase
MRLKGVDCLVVAGLKGREELDGYLSNDYAEGIVLFPLEGAPLHLTWVGTRIIRSMESASRGNVQWIEDIRVGVIGQGLVSALKEKGFAEGRVGVVGVESVAPGEPEGYFPYKTWAHVLKELPNARFTDLSASFAEMMLVKSEEELHLIRYSAEIGEEACKRLLEMARPGVSERDLYTAITGVLFENGASSPAPFLILHSGVESLSWGPPLWHYQGGAARVIQAGDLVQAEIFPRYGGLDSQQQMSVHLKPTNNSILELAKIARESYDVGLDTLRPGKTFREICEAMEGPISKAKCWHLTPLIHSLSPQGWTSGTGVGIEQAAGLEALKGRVRSRTINGGDLILKKGMVFELEPNACRGRQRVNIGGTVVVTENGEEELNKLPTEMQVKG